MGSNQFQREYIEYLQERNTELLNKLTHMKENYENKIFSKDLNKHYLISTLEDVLNVCTVLPQEIDLFFDNMTAAMGLFKNILLRKSEMVQLVEKISRAINPGDNVDAEIMQMNGPGLVKEQTEEVKSGKKAGTVKVSPMINGHIISTEPKIYLNRISRNFTTGGRNESQLSPIIEASPDTSGSSSGSHVFRELRIPLERLNLNKLNYNYGSEVIQESPKSRFKGPKTWKKSLSSNKRQPEIQTSTFLENNEGLNKKSEVDEKDSQGSDVDPLEGPSWLYNENNDPTISPLGNRSTGFIDYRRRKHRFATVFDRGEDYVDVRYCNEKAEEVPKESDFYEGCRRSTKNKHNQVKEFLKRISDASEDFICESANEREDTASPYAKRNRKSSRNCIEEESGDDGFSEFEVNVKKESSTPYSKDKPKENTSEKSDSHYEADNEEIPSCKKRRKSYRKRISKSIFDSVSMDISLEKTPKESKQTERESRSSTKKKTTDSKSKIKEEDIKEMKEVLVNLEDIMVTRGQPKLSQARSPSEKKKGSSSRGKSRSGSPQVVAVTSENEGRKKRKAAPVNLAEPKLSTKLRRE